MKPNYDLLWLLDKYDNGETLKFIFFWGHTNKSPDVVNKACFSQWYESSFIVNGILYPTTEHWMMAHKALLFNNRAIFEKIIQVPKPSEVKRLGRMVTGFNQQIWDTKKREIVKIGNIHKFNQHPKLADFLLSTEKRILVEASPVDNIWGIGLSQDNDTIENIYTWQGENLLGFIFGHNDPSLKLFYKFNFEKWAHFPKVANMDGIERDLIILGLRVSV